MSRDKFACTDKVTSMHLRAIAGGVVGFQKNIVEWLLRAVLQYLVNFVVAYPCLIGLSCM